MSSDSPIVLNEEFLLSLASNKAVQGEFSYFGEVIKNLQNSKGCQTCNRVAVTNRATVATKIKNHLMNMRQADIEKLKTLLNIPTTRKFRTYLKQGTSLVKVEI